MNKVSVCFTGTPRRCSWYYIQSNQSLFFCLLLLFFFFLKNIQNVSTTRACKLQPTNQISFGITSQDWENNSLPERLQKDKQRDFWHRSQPILLPLPVRRFTRGRHIHRLLHVCGDRKYISSTNTYTHTYTLRESQRSDERDEKRIHGEPGGLDKYWPEWMRSVTVHKKGYTLTHGHTSIHASEEPLGL